MNKANECTCPSGDGSLVHPCPAHPAVEQAGGDERAAFEAAFAAMGRPVCRADYDQDAYGTPFDDGGWTGWQARAALAQPSPALPPFAEKVLAKLSRFYDCASDFESGGVDIGRHWLDLLTQLGLLNRVQRSPALWEISQQGEDLLEAPVAQAQHSVPEGWRIERSAERIVVMNMKNGAGYAAARDGESGIAESVLYLLAADLLAAAPGMEVPQAWLDVQAERRRQITAEGWTPEHDDLYCAAELPRAAAAYILNGANDEAPAIWPFVTKWWKPRDARSNYVRAGALILAEIERLDRARQGGRS